MKDRAVVHALTSRYLLLAIISVGNCMTKRSYYTNAYTVDFIAPVVRCETMESGTVVILEESYFYPNSGGQPADMGTLHGLPVVDVVIRPEDGAVLHLLAADVTAEALPPSVTCTIDWERRFDHMQQHTGQHILSQAFLEVAAAETVSFHLGEDACTIDLARLDVTAEALEAAEKLANRIIWQNRPVHIRFVEAAEAANLPLRKRPPTVGDTLRLIEIENFDTSACGGTHVRYTGEIGLIKITKTEKRGNKLRVEFQCGGRALADYKEKHTIVSDLSTLLTTGYDQLVSNVEKLTSEIKELRRTLKKQQALWLQQEAQALLLEAECVGNAQLVMRVFADREAADLRELADQITAVPNAIALLALAGESTHLVFKRGEEASGDMGQLLRDALLLLGSARGGGSAVMAQGGGVAATPIQLSTVLARSRAQLFKAAAQNGGPQLMN